MSSSLIASPCFTSFTKAKDCRPAMTRADFDDVVAAFSKVFDDLAALRDFAAAERKAAE